LVWPLDGYYCKVPAFGSANDAIPQQQLVHFYQNEETHQRYLRVVIRQLVKKEKRDPKDEDEEDDFIEIHAMRFYVFGEDADGKPDFVEQYSTIYDVSDGLLEHQSGTFSNEFFLHRINTTYFFRREE